MTRTVTRIASCILAVLASACAADQPSGTPTCSCGTGTEQYCDATKGICYCRPVGGGGPVGAECEPAEGYPWAAPPLPDAWRLSLSHQGAIRGACDVEPSLYWDVVSLGTDRPTLAQVEALGGAPDCLPLEWEADFGQWRLTCDLNGGTVEWQVVVPADADGVPTGVGDQAYRVQGDCVDHYDAAVVPVD